MKDLNKLTEQDTMDLILAKIKKLNKSNLARTKELEEINNRLDKSLNITAYRITLNNFFNDENI